MKKIIFSFAMLISTVAIAQISRPNSNVEIINEKNDTTIFVVAHRSDWRNAPENSLQGIKNCIKMGVDMVEIDLKKTKDGHLILMHDKTIDRTTTGKGMPSDYTLAEIKEFRLRNGAGHKTNHKVPTLEEVMLLCKGKIMVNIDKGYDFFKETYAILEKTGTINQCIMKSNKPFSEVQIENGELLKKMPFMPVVHIDQDGARDIIEGYIKNTKPIAFELCFDNDSKEVRKIIRYVRKKRIRIFINSLWPELCGYHHDDRAVEDMQPDESWGWIIKQGATLIQTDRPLELIKYLEYKGLHTNYTKFDNKSSK